MIFDVKKVKHSEVCASCLQFEYELDPWDTFAPYSVRLTPY